MTWTIYVCPDCAWWSDSGAVGCPEHSQSVPVEVVSKRVADSLAKAVEGFVGTRVMRGALADALDGYREGAE